MAPDDPESALDRLGAHSADGPRLVSVYVAPEQLVDEAIVLLDEEHTKEKEIHSVEQRKMVQKSLIRLQNELAGYDTPPENGMALFCGRLDGEWVEETLETPPRAVEQFQYRCDRTFHVEPFSG